MRQITLMTTTCSKRLIGDGARRTVADSGELLQKETGQFDPLHASLDAKLLLGDLHDEAPLLDLPSDSGVISIDGYQENSGDPPGLVKIAVRNREGLREIEKAEKHQGSSTVLGGVL
jgi:hypothetical protein